MPATTGWRGSGRRVATAVLAALAVAASGVFLWRAFTPADLAAPVETPLADPWAALPEGWTELPSPPERVEGATLVWAGGRLLAWGGFDPETERALAGGYALDPTAMAWRDIPPAPIARDGAHAVWTGTEAVFVGGWADRDRMDGVAFDPGTDTWRPIPEAPLEPRHPAVTVWTGTEIVVWGGGDRDDDATNRSGAAYDPATDAWRRLSDAPLGLNLASGMWTGQEMIVFGSLLDNRNHAETDTAVGAAYDPERDTWRELPPSHLSPQSSAAVWIGDRLIAYDYVFASAEYVRDRDAWRDLPRVPVDQGECYVDATVVAGRAFAWTCGDAAVLVDGDWKKVTGGITDITTQVYGRPFPLYRFATLVPADDVLLFLAIGITVNEKGTPSYGGPGAPVSFWAYKPSA